MNNINKKDVPNLIQKYIPQQAQEQAAGVNNTIGEVKSDSDNEMPTLDIHQQKKIKIQEVNKAVREEKLQDGLLGGVDSDEEESNDEDKVLDQLVKNAEEIHKF